MGFEDRAYVFAGHMMIFVCVMICLYRLVPMAAAARRGECPHTALAHFPLAVMLVAVMAFVEALYYGLARLLISEGVNLWDQTVVVGLMRMGVATSVYLHMPAYLIWRGCRPQSIPQLLGMELLTIWLAWGGLVLVLW